MEPPDTFTLLFLLGDLLIFVEDFVGFGFDTGQFDEHLKVFYIIHMYLYTLKNNHVRLEWVSSEITKILDYEILTK